MDYDFNGQKQIVYKTSYTAAGVFAFICIVLAGFLGYKYYTFEMIEKKDFKKNYIKKDDIAFEDLPSYIKSDYISNFRHNQKIDELNSKIAQFSAPKIEEKIVEVEKIVEKIVKIDSNIDKSNFKSYRCFDMIGGDYVPSKTCIEELKIFLDQNKEAKLFEVIGVGNGKGFEFTNLVNDEDLKKKLKNYETLAQKGLIQKRVEEAVWEIKKYLGLKTNVQTATYDLELKEGEKGFILRAYR